MEWSISVFHFLFSVLKTYTHILKFRSRNSKSLEEFIFPSSTAKKKKFDRSLKVAISKAIDVWLSLFESIRRLMRIWKCLLQPQIDFENQTNLARKFLLNEGRSHVRTQFVFVLWTGHNFMEISANFASCVLLSINGD